MCVYTYKSHTLSYDACFQILSKIVHVIGVRALKSPQAMAAKIKQIRAREIFDSRALDASEEMSAVLKGEWNSYPKQVFGSLGGDFIT